MFLVHGFKQTSPNRENAHVVSEHKVMSWGWGAGSGNDIATYQETISHVLSIKAMLLLH